MGQTGRASCSNVCFLLRCSFHLEWGAHTHVLSLSLKMVYPKREKEKKGCGAWGRWWGPGPAQLSSQRFQDTDAWALAAGEGGGRPLPTS